MRIKYKNEWGAEGSNLDQQRADLFRVSLNIPNGGVGVWSNAVEFAIEKFPFPETKVETFATKYMQQVNHQVGGDVATAPIEIPVRYAFAAPTAQALYRWQYMVSNPRTGGVALTSAIKCGGRFQWLVPDMAKASNPDSADQDVLKVGLEYTLEGCIILGLKPTDGDMTTGNQPVNLMFSLSIDRYYPTNISNMIVLSRISATGATTLVQPIGNVA